MEKIYLDNSATTPLVEEARLKMLEAMDTYGNPSSLHSIGIEAEKLISEAKRNILEALGISAVSTGDRKQLIFTSSGTEADNLALLGTVGSRNYTTQKNIIISDSEHPAIMETAKELERRGFIVHLISTADGLLDYDDVAKYADQDTVLASVMLVNNETGAIYDVKRVSDIVKKANPAALIHTDCTQAFLKIRFTAEDLGADMITLSAHKIGGPKGVGALWLKPELIRKGAISPIIFGGGQENGLRSGTENVIGIAGFGAAAKIGFEKLDEHIATITDIHDKMVAALSDRSRFPGLELNTPDGPSAPHIISILMPMIRSEVMLHALEHEGIYVSSGSACSSNTGEISHVLQAFGLTAREADSSIRVSIGFQNTLADADGFVEEFADLLISLLRIVRGPSKR